MCGRRGFILCSYLQKMSLFQLTKKGKNDKIKYIVPMPTPQDGGFLLMSTQQETNRRSDVIRCEFCGEDYSVTYRKCPFCDDMPSRPASRPASGGKGGRRQAGGGRGSAPDPVRIVGLALGFVLIIAAAYIVYSLLSPLFASDGPDLPASSGQSSVSISVSQPDASPDVSVPDVSVPDVSVPDVSTPNVVTPLVKTTAITLSSSDFTLKANETQKLVATVTPADSDDDIVWSSSDSSIATVDETGTITNVNAGTSLTAVTITAKSGDFTATCIVRCRPGSSGTATNPPAPSGSSTTAAPGTVGTVTGTTSGLLIRTGPGRNYEAQDTATNGAKVTILEKTADGWYKISYTGNGGRTVTGYVSVDYVTVD